MSSPPQRRSCPGLEARATSTTATVADADTTAVDRQLVGDESLWVALFDGRFRLSVRCDVCGRWLTAGKSKVAGRGPSCSARAVTR